MFDVFQKEVDRIISLVKDYKMRRFQTGFVLNEIDYFKLFVLYIYLAQKLTR